MAHRPHKEGWDVRKLVTPSRMSVVSSGGCMGRYTQRNAKSSGKTVPDKNVKGLFLSLILVKWLEVW